MGSRLPQRLRAVEPAAPGARAAQGGRQRARRGAENTLFGWIFDFLKNTPQADLSGFEVPPSAEGGFNGLNIYGRERTEQVRF